MKRKLISFAVASCFVAEFAYANPTGPSVVSGSATFATAGSALTVTNSPNAIINWQRFSIGAGEITRFQQQSAASAVLNRVVGQDPSAILGTLWSNGRVFLVNPNGILFGQGSRVDVAGLVASTLNITNADFLGGRLNFQAGAVANSIVNEGELHSATGGHIYLVSPDITNSGLISSPKGEVVLAAGKSVSLVDIGTPNLKVEVSAPEASARNLGQIVAESGRIGVYAGLINQQGVVRADTVTQDATGRIVFKASDTTLLEAGSVTSAAGAKGGEIQVLGNKVGMTGDALIDASGEAGGGTVLFGGDFQGKNAGVPNAFRTYFGAQAAIRADAITSGDGGKVILWSDDATRAYGTVSARGGALGGDGGLVEVSGKRWLDFGVNVDTRAPLGKSGTLWLDPTDIYIADSLANAQSAGMSGSDASIDSSGPALFVVAGTPSESLLTTGVLTSALASNNVTVSTESGGAGTGNIRVVDDVSWNSANSLTLLARGSTLVGAAITNGGTGSISIYAGWDGLSTANPATPNTGSILVFKNIQTGGSLRLQGGSAVGSLVQIKPDNSDLSLSVGADLNVSGLDLTIAADANGVTGRKATITVGGTFNAQLSGAFLMRGNGASPDGPGPIDEGTFDGSVSLQANAVTVNAGGNITIRGGDDAHVALGSGTKTGNLNADAAITATTSIALSGADVEIRGGDFTRASANQFGSGDGGVKVASASAKATLTAGTSLTISGTNITIRGGDSSRAEASNNGRGIGGVNTGSATADAGVNLSGGAVSLTATSALLVRGGDNAFARALANGSNGTGTGTATVSANALVHAGQNLMIAVTGLPGTATIRGGQNASAGASDNGRSSGNGSGAAAANANATVSAAGNLALTAGSLTVNGGDDGAASASSNGLGTVGEGVATVNANATLSAGTTLTLGTVATPLGSLTVRGGNNANASADSSGRNTATMNAKADVIGADVAMSVDGPVAIRGGVDSSASGGRGDTVGGANTADLNASALVHATNTLSLTVNGGDVTVAGGDGNAVSGSEAIGTHSITSRTDATLSSGGDMSLSVTGGGLTVRGGDNAQMSGSASSDPSLDAQMLLSAKGKISSGGALSMTVSGAVSIQGGLNADASGSGSDPTNVSQLTVNADASVEATGNVSLTTGSLTVRGGDTARGTASDSGKIMTTVTATGSLSAGGTLTINSTGAMLVRGGNDAFASASGNSAAAQNTATITTTGGVNSGGLLTISAGSLTVQGGTQGASFFARIFDGSGTNASTTNANASLVAANGMTYTGGAVTVQGGTARAQGGAGGTATATANSLMQVTGAGTMDVTGNFDLIGGSAHSGVVSGASASAVASVLGSNDVTSSGVISVGTTTGTVSGNNSSVTPSMTALPSGAIALNADDINIGTDIISVGNAGTMTFGTFSTTRDLVFETVKGATANVLSITPTDFGGITAGMMVLRAGRDLFLQADLGTSVSPYDRSVELRAGNNAQITTNSVYLANERSLIINADNDSSGAGSLNIGAVTLKIGTGSTTGSMTLEGQEVNIVVSGGGTGLLEVAGPGTQFIRANSSTGTLRMENANTTSGSLTVRTGGTQVITAAGDLEIVAGTGTNTNVLVQAGGNEQIVTAGSLYIQGGNAGSGNAAMLQSLGTGSNAQSVSATSITMLGGADGGGFGVGNAAFLFSAGSQSITVGSGGLTLTGGGHPSSAGTTDNAAIISQQGLGGTQTVTVNDGGSIVLTGGHSPLTAVGTTHGSRALLEARGTSQAIDFTAGGAMTFTGGTSGSRNYAQIFVENGSQTITGAPTLAMDGGTSGGIDGEGNFARIYALGDQTLSFSSVLLRGGTGGMENFAQILKDGASGMQSITVPSGGISLRGGSGGGGFDTGNFAQIRSNGSQVLNVTGGMLLEGGSGTLTDNFASVLQTLASGTQTVNMNGGGTLELRGGSTQQSGIGTAAGHGSFAFVTNDGTSQTIDFASGGEIQIEGGTVGSRNNAGILARAGTQTISGAPHITLTGGASGGVDNEGNSALIQSVVGAQTITASNVALQAGAGGINNFAAILAPTQVITVLGDLLIKGGASSASADGTIGGGARIGGNGGATPSSTNLTLVVDGEVQLTGGSVANSGAVIGNNAQGGQTTTITMDVGRNVTLNPGTVAGAGSRIGSPAAPGIAGGDILITAGDTIALNSNPGLGTFIRTLGNVTLNAASITQGPDSAIIAGGTTSLNAGAISLDSSVNDFGGVVNITGGTVFIEDANTLTLGAVQATQLTASASTITQDSSGIDVSGLTSLTAGSVALTTATNDFGTVNVTSGGNVAITDANAITIGTSSVGGTFDVVGSPVNFSGGLTATNYSFSNGSYTLATGTYNLSGTTTVSSTATVTASGATISAGTIDVAGSVQTTGGSFTASAVNVSGSFTASGGTVNVGTLDVLAGGVLSGTGTIVGNVNNLAGTVSPGASPGTLTIDGSYTQGPSGVLDVQIGGLVAGSDYDQLKVIGTPGTASLGGTLNTTLINGFVPVAGQTFTFIDAAGGITGTFTTINQPAGALFNSFYGLTTFEFIAAAAGSAPAPIAPTFNYSATTTDQVLTELTNDLTSPSPGDDIIIAPVLEGTTTTAEGTVALKPPACN